MVKLSLNRAEVVLTEICQTKAIINLIINEGVNNADIANALEAVNGSLERASKALTTVDDGREVHHG